jgi:hypothetical protein
MAPTGQEERLLETTLILQAAAPAITMARLLENCKPVSFIILKARRSNLPGFYFDSNFRESAIFAPL